MEFIDRVSTYPNRYKMTDEDGKVTRIVLERDDEPIAEGTPLNAETFNSLFLYAESKEYPGCYYRIVDGMIEWINPPMNYDTVYRTTKKLRGYPVYVVAVYFPALAEANDYVWVSLAKFNIAHILSINTTYYNNLAGRPFRTVNDPFVDTDGVYAIAYIEMNDSLCIKTCDKIGLTDYSALCLVEFTIAEEAL